MKTLRLSLHLFLLLLAAPVLASADHSYTSSSQYGVSSPDAVFREGTNGTTYLISPNGTSATVDVMGTQTEIYLENVLNITNLSLTSNYTIKIESMSITCMDRLANFTVYIHDGTISKQVEVSHGSLTKSSGAPYDLGASSTIYLSLAVNVTSLGISTADLRLHLARKGTTSPEMIQTVRFNVETK